MNSWTCKIQTDASKPGTITVGEAVGFECEGPEVQLNDQALRIQVVGAPDPFAIKLLEVGRLIPTGAQLKVTSYRPQLDPALKFVLTDGENSVELSGLHLQVESVITAPNATPFGAYTPWKISFPVWMWGVLILAVTLALMGAFFKVRRMRVRRRLVLEIEEYRKRHDPFSEFQKELRQLLRRIERGAIEIPRADLQSIEKSFRLFLKRLLFDETESLSSRAIALKLTERYEGADSAARKVQEVLVEVARLKGDAVGARDAEQVARWIGEASELVSDLDSAKEAP